MVNLDLLPTEDVLGLLLDAEARVVPAVRAALPELAAAVDLLARRWQDGGRWVFVGAGTSGRIAVAEAAELPGTFGIPRDRVPARVAGGDGSTDRDEDDLGLADADAAALRLTAADVVVAVAASGSTPYTLTIARAARTAEAAVVAVTTTAGTPLEELADVAIAAVPGAEVLRGSSRLTAGTAQKVALNALTTAAMARIGRIHGELMIDVEPANAKLRERAAGIVAEIAGCDLATARAALAECHDNARAAVLRLSAGLAPAAAAELSDRHPRLRDALTAAANASQSCPDQSIDTPVV